MFLSLEGILSTGKSSLMYSAPLPGVFMAFDAGATRSLFGSRHDHLFKGVDIQIVQYPPSPDTTPGHPVLTDLAGLYKYWNRTPRCITVYLMPQPSTQGLKTSNIVKGAIELWDLCTMLCNLSLMYVPTTGIDTGTIARRVAADAYLQDIQQRRKQNDPIRQQLIQIEWSKPDGYMRQLYSSSQNQLEASGFRGIQRHMVITHHLTEERVDVMSAGEVKSVIKMSKPGIPDLTLEGLKKTYNFVDVALRMENRAVQVPDLFDDRKKVVEQQIWARFMKCGLDLSLKDTEVRIDDWDTLARHINRNLHPMAQIQLRDSEVLSGGK